MTCNGPECGLGLPIINIGGLSPLGGVTRESQVGSQENGFYSIWPENKRMFDLDEFYWDVTEALNEAVGAGFFTTEYELQVKGDRVEFWSPKVKMEMLASMQEAIAKQQELITQETDLQTLELLEMQLRRLRMEYLGMQRVGRLLQVYDQVIWISPPGLGLESGETRINYLFKRDGKVINYSWVATPDLEYLKGFMRWFGYDLADDMGLATGSFLSSPFRVEVSVTEIAKKIRDLNRLSGYQVPGWGVDLYDLMDFVRSFRQVVKKGGQKGWIDYLQKGGVWFDLKEELEKQIISFYTAFYGKGVKPTHEIEAAFLQALLEKIIKPWLRVWVWVKYKEGIDNFDFVWNQLMARSSGCGTGLGSGLIGTDPFLVGTNRLWWGLGSVMWDLFKLPGCKKCGKKKGRKEKKKKKDKE